ncbi:MAG TPA: class I SAM-dependent methyltransferase [Candidatus Eisenbacteria bacterium]
MKESKQARDARSLREMFEMIGERFLDLPFTKGTAQEVEFLVEMLDLTPKDRLLDLACGPGRHAVALGKQGIRVTGVDLSDRLLALAAQAAELEGVTTVEFVKGDAREMPYNEEFDAAICLCEGAFGLLETDIENERVLNAIYRALKPGGRMALTCLSLYHLMRKGQDLTAFDPQTNMYEREEMIQVEGGSEELFRFHERYYDFPGLKILLERVGFRHILGFGCRAGEYSRRAITLDDVEILVYAQKPVR